MFVNVIAISIGRQKLKVPKIINILKTFRSVCIKTYYKNNLLKRKKMRLRFTNDSNSTTALIKEVFNFKILKCFILSPFCKHFKMFQSFKLFHKTKHYVFGFKLLKSLQIKYLSLLNVCFAKIF